MKWNIRDKSPAPQSDQENEGMPSAQDGETTVSRRMMIGMATFLSLLSLAWTTYSIIDLAGVGWPSLSVALASDLVWTSFLIAEWRQAERAVDDETTKLSTAGWIAATIVGAVIAFHAVDRMEGVMAVTGLLPLATKLIWTHVLRDKKAEYVYRAALRARQEQEQAEEASRQAARSDDPTEEQLREVADRKRAARHAKALAEAEEDRLKAEAQAKISEIQAQARIRMEEERQDMEIRMERSDMIRELQRKELFLTIPGEIQRSETLPGGNHAASGETNRPILMPTTGLTEAQKERKRIAALWYRRQEEQQMGLWDRNLNQAEFAATLTKSNGDQVSPQFMSRCVNEFTRDRVSAEDIAQAS